ncbi:MAG: hypothetical protein F4Y99_00950 [Acidimicrobiaceae bacterium]|nr:hypothetical protein [Acidimicrobiaceae bacterium]MDE0517649.1 hypothetical protein [Acidimicrobiaceae bacterium]MDE0655559.1 hypothetical protein [Acidimicrobiaceae bacterium]MXZ94481.1 hypothetical protein [Acidimicrobiaceae bacterium]MYF44112.1 hypothetical protein [Acidimicrobiaceae bacterium]
MSVVSAIHASAAVLLLVAGVAKLARPADGFAGLVGFRARPFLVRILGGGEVVAGVGALWLGGPVAASAVGLLYAAFALAVLRALLTGAESCGCFGRLDAPPSRVHVLGNLALAGVSFVAAGADVAPVQAIVQSISDRPAYGAALALEIVLMAGLGLVAFTALPEALGARTARAARHDSSTLFRSVPPPAAEPREPVPVPGGRR